MKIDRKNKPERVSHYIPYEADIKLGKIQCPVPVTKIPVIERLNNIRINVFGYEDDEVFPLYVSPQENEDCINLLYISNEGGSHYCLIKNFSRLMGDLTRHKTCTFYCYRCLHRFSEERNLKNHITFCKEHSPQHIKMPSEEDKFLSFRNQHFQHPIPYIIYADFEAIVKKVHTSEPSHATSYTQPIMKHEACGYAYIVIGPDGKSLKPAHVYRGSDAVDNFLQNIIREKDELAETLTHIVPLIMTPQQEQDFLTATICNLCKKPLYKDRVRDHDHLTGHYRGALHSLCNLKYRLQKKIPVVFHNLKHYDAHHIMQGLGKIEDHQIEVIATNMEKYITFALSKKHNKIKVSLQFIDSFQFLNTSLEKLVQNLPAEKFNILKENVREGDLSLLLKKGIYPYDYIQSFEMFEETALPPPAAFHNSLTDEEISASDYEHAQAVWNSFNIRTMGEYHDLYVKSDVLQLADVFENFRKLCLQFYEIDCAHVMTSPGLSWQACLKMIEQPLELLTDVDMHLFIEQGIRGGISVITKRWAQANNHYMPNYDSTNPESYIMYLDANNLYGWAMSQALPYGEFEWISAEAVTPEWILSISENSTEGYILEVDLEYPPELHDAHNDYPLAPEKKADISGFNPIF
ncbi:uncharacterized protein LOC118183516 [Stegodyphus dumicola]|uniref:uncharacterized protein LOC118183516 n=1 Tax=Stegodyphus dumicola TaxID=202533 RepID=UPI0015B11832|nr:uncharacterized protein LOC118183516 [Stegodyphus dumicola]